MGSSVSPSASPSVSPSYEPAFEVTHLVHDRGNSIKLVKITLRAYTTDGIPVSAGDCGLRKLRGVILSGSVQGYPLWWDQVHKKILVYKAVGTQMDDDAKTVTGMVVYALAVGY